MAVHSLVALPPVVNNANYVTNSKDVAQSAKFHHGRPTIHGVCVPSNFLRHERIMHQRHLTAGITELTKAVHSHTNRCQCGSKTRGLLCAKHKQGHKTYTRWSLCGRIAVCLVSGVRNVSVLPSCVFLCRNTFGRKEVQTRIGLICIYSLPVNQFLGVFTKMWIAKFYIDQRNAQVFNVSICLLLPYMFRAFF
jgi:hypothetical protein